MSGLSLAASSEPDQASGVPRVGFRETHGHPGERLVLAMFFPEGLESLVRIAIQIDVGHVEVGAVGQIIQFLEHLAIALSQGAAMVNEHVVGRRPPSGSSAA